jgi:hypothetical protein
MSLDEKTSLLNSLPPGTLRVQVKTLEGKTTYKFPDQVLGTDEVVLTSAGVPIVMKGKPGRPQSAPLPPASPVIAEVVRAREDHLFSDNLISATKSNPEGDSVFNHLMVELSSEISALEFERKEAERLGKDSSEISSKRVRAIKTMTDAWMKKRERSESGAIDLEGESFKKLFAFILETIRASMGDAGMRAEHIETVFAKLSKRIADGWMEDAKNRMK